MQWILIYATETFSSSLFKLHYGKILSIYKKYLLEDIRLDNPPLTFFVRQSSLALYPRPPRLFFPGAALFVVLRVVIRIEIS